MSDPYRALKQSLVATLRRSAGIGGPGARAVLKTAPAQAMAAAPEEFLPVDTSGVGEFPWEWNSFGTFSAETWHFLNTLAARTSDDVIALSAGLTTRYFNLISATAYLWTDQDRAELEQHLTAAAQARSQLVTSYQSLFAPISPTDKAAAAAALGRGPLSNVDYVVEYRIAYEWSGRQAQGLPPLDAAGIRAAWLDSLFAQAPASAPPALLPPLRAALKHEADWAARIDALWNTSHSIRKAAGNTHAPDPGNESGMYTVDRSGVNAVRHSFSVAPSVNAIRADLSAANVLEMSFSAQSAPGGTALVAAPGAAPSHVPASVVALTDAQGAERSLFSHDGAGDKAEIRVQYHGPAEITLDLAPFEADRATGWFFDTPIRQAAANHAQGLPAGYQFQVPVGPVAGTAFGFLKSLLVCREVTLRVVYPDGDLHRLSQSVPTGAGVSATLLGQMRVTDQAQRPVTARVEPDPGTGAPSLVLNAGAQGQPGTPGPLAHVIGARIARPFAEAAPVLSQRLQTPRLFATAQARVAPQAAAPAAMPLPKSQPRPADPLVAAYENVFGTIPAAQLSRPGPAAKRDFILTEVLGAEWSGRRRAGRPPLSLAEMREAANLRSLFPDMPLEGAALLTELHDDLARGG
ncbi:hypothetical protein SAMN05421759_1142 [Roseivivax lentus]|uniref:Uncharacterized protein n=1 Tax=Roseivivax lentus TaxID=633194 RepID=A0A1N7P9Z1_9RHOB|nr:hypothetical protein [Roseivivax lentus]SIT07368.1 hypothetical protein SAMN05421759_1142 [Roseivivax lentus]